MTDQTPGPDTFSDLLGGVSANNPVSFQILEMTNDTRHTRQLIEYSTTGEELVQAFVLIPEIRSALPMPGLVAIHQDGASRPYDHGKSEVAGIAGDPELAYGLAACLRGYVVICPDRFGFESRKLARSSFAQLFAKFRISLTDENVDLTEDLYKGCVANQLLFEGWTALGKELLELRRAVDCLCALDIVDSYRVGALGHSAGGLLAALLMFMDERVRVGCVSCGTWLIQDMYRHDFLRPMQGFGGLLAVPGLQKWGDIDDVLAGIAPRPYWEARGDLGDDYQLDRLVGKARRKYAELDVPERFEYVAHKAGHAFPEDLQQEALDWLDQCLT